MLEFTAATRDPSKLPLVLDTAVRLSGSPQYAYVRPMGNPADHAYLSITAERENRSDAWKPLPPGTGADGIAAELVLALPEIAERGFRLSLVDPELSPGSEPTFRIEIYGR